ncbi:MAG: hypothetical protein PHU46_06135 [Rhodocyclaceae bacterium]|nr:hypothetical protein [Rhodocyclaceae bacterium]
MNLFSNERTLILTPSRAYPRHGAAYDALCPFEGEGLGMVPEEWQGRLERLAGHEGFPAGPVRLLVSDAWVRYDLIPVATDTMDDEEARLLAEAHFRRQYGAPLWPLRISARPGGLLVAGMSPELLAALEALQGTGKPAPKGVRKPIGIEPVFSWLMDQASDTLRGYTGWLLVDEAEILVLAFFEQGKLLSLRSQYCGDDRQETMLGLLERQAALETRKDRAVFFHALSGAPPSLPGPWNMAPLNLPERSGFSRLSSLLKGK